MRAYYLLWLKTAFTHSLGKLDLWTGLIVVALGIFGHYWPQTQLMTTYGWQIPIWALAGIMLMRLFLAPYWIARDQKKVSKCLQDQLDERKRRQRTVDKLAQLHQQCLQLLMITVDSNDDYTSWKQEIEDWYKRAQTEIEGSLGFAEMELFRTFSAPVFFDLSFHPFSERHQHDLRFFGARHHKLRIIIDDMNNRLR